MPEKKDIDYKATLNLPKTDFPMRAKLNQKEPLIFQKWQEMGLDKVLLQNRDPEKRFTLHDGPPYANGDIHMGHALNKILKDIIVRYMILKGYYSHYVPGWDCHGLPIEQKVRENLGAASSEKSPLEMRQLCAKYALGWVKTQSEQFQRIGIGGDFSHPYKTLTREYETGILKAFRTLVENHYVYRGRKPVFWCIDCGTALADAEVEYNNHISDSIYVHFPIVNLENLKELKDIGSCSIVIWTTTPWTLPANVAVCVHPQYEYVAARVSKSGKTYILAHYLLQGFLSQCDLGKAEILAKFKGSVLEGLECRHPLLDKKSVIILGDHVTLEQGTGCVHTAPGHGYEDYLMLLKYKLPMVMPVDDNGCFTEDFEMMKGISVWDANELIIDNLKERELLIHSEKTEHSYPHCWRCHKPIIFRATQQWFMSIDKNDLRQKVLKSIDEVNWIPAWSRDRIYNMVAMRPDWCLSRQRKWGVPIPAIQCLGCGEDILALPVIDLFLEQVKKDGTDAWFTTPDESVIPKGFRCPKCGHTSFKKKTDTLDVWFDSGASHIAVCEQIEDLGTPVDLYLEGSDQHRGWFQSSLIVGMGARKHAPYKSVLTHGFILDAKGEAMSKSKGNVMPPQQIIEKMGADVLRLWVSSEDYREDVRISLEILDRISDAYRRIRNTFRFLLGNLGDFDPQKNKISYDNLQEIDKWALHKTADLTKRVIKAYDNYEFHKIYHLVHTFCVVDMSALYLDIVKDRLYVEGSNSPERRSCQTVLYEIARILNVVLAPILPYTMEEVYQSLEVSTGYQVQNPLTSDKPLNKSVHCSELPNIPETWIRPDLMEKWTRLLKLREITVKALEEARRDKVIGHSLDAIVYLYTNSQEYYSFLMLYREFLADFCIVSGFETEFTEVFDKTHKPLEADPHISLVVKKASWQKCVRCWKLHPDVNKDPEYPDVCPRCARVLKEYVS